MNIGVMVGLVGGLAVGMAAWGDTLFELPQSPSGGTVMSAYLAPDGWDGDQFAWERFVLPGAADITEVRWRGALPGAGTTGTGVTDFEVSIWASIPVGTQPLVTAPLVHYLITDNGGGEPGNAHETFAGNVGGTNFYDYSFTLPTPFAAAAGVPYWVQVIAWRPGSNSWGWAKATGGNNNHFERVPVGGGGDYWFRFNSGDCAFSLLGAPIMCNSPSITADPAPVTLCASGLDATFSVGAEGTGTLQYRWRFDGVALSDGPGGYSGGSWVMGSTTPNLTVTGIIPWANGRTYDCVVTNACGATTSAGALVTVNPGACAPFCDSIDYNADGLFPDTLDIDDFLSVFSGGACSTGTCGDIDFNNDGLFPDTLDIDSLLSVFSGGACL